MLFYVFGVDFCCCSSSVGGGVGLLSCKKHKVGVPNENESKPAVYVWLLNVHRPFLCVCLCSSNSECHSSAATAAHPCVQIKSTVCGAIIRRRLKDFNNFCRTLGSPFGVTRALRKLFQSPLCRRRRRQVNGRADTTT